jgi:hypothetical protein
MSDTLSMASSFRLSPESMNSLIIAASRLSSKADPSQALSSALSCAVVRTGMGTLGTIGGCIFTIGDSVSSPSSLHDPKNDCKQR